MNCDSAFPDYTKKITYLLLVLAAVGGIVTQLIWGWRVSVAFSLAALFHAAFFLFLRKMYLFWTETGRDNLFIGRRIAEFASGRFFIEILLCVLVVVFTPLNILGFLAGLLSLVAATYWERIASAIKE
ncbi:hypothetical protein [uncultured Dialister sp.]|jgi:hypothetical protein|uniref:hypothetical protein n=1 Tax=uncultured Dialister sp. TaxID=278064 RepID=UPI00266FF94E|nr:hypothetical protein [uncultured Dialister sp.]